MSRYAIRLSSTDDELTNTKEVKKMLKRTKLLNYVMVLILAAPFVTAQITAMAESKVEEVSITSSYWTTPELPIKPDSVSGVNKPVISLNTVAGNGDWEFLFTPPTGAAAPPSWTAANQNFDFSAWDGRDWQAVLVPSDLSMQGFDIGNGTEYFYKKEVTPPADFVSNRVMLRFDSVYSNTRVWVNGTFVRSHLGGFTAWDCDISDYVTPGQAFTLVVGVIDSTGDPSDGSGYAHHNMGGITRDVTLYALPKDYIKHLYVNTTFDNDFIDADLEITAQLGMASNNAALEIELYDNTGALVLTDSINFSKGAQTDSDSTAAKKITIPVDEPLQWDAEHPNLYTLKTAVTVAGAAKETASQKIGFREVTYGGDRGTDINKVYVNGKEIKLRGTCRHDVSFYTGRSITREEAFHEIKSFKEANINFIRTSHYPVMQAILDACDEYGVYVEHETAVCWTGAAPIANYLNQFTELIEKDRNHPCTIIWSLANESTFESAGANGAFRTEFNYVKDIDRSRPTIFSYPSTVSTSPRPYDIYSSHYPGNNSGLGSSQYPVLHDEYAHIPCYDLGELRLDPNVRNFWGESVKMFWERMFETDGCLGGALWGGIDDEFQLPPGVSERHQSHAPGPTAGYGGWGSVLDVYGRLKPEAYLTKKAYTPIRLEPDNFNITGNTVVFPVKNWFDHTDFNELDVTYSYDGAPAATFNPSSLPPHTNGFLTVPGFFADANSLSLKFYQGEWLIDEYKVDLKPTKHTFTPPSATAPTIVENTDSITVNGANFSVVFDKETAKISTATFKGTLMLTGGPDLHGITSTEAATSELCTDWIPAASNAITAEIVDNMAVVTIRGSYTSVPNVTFNVSISGNGIITTDYTVGTMSSSYTNLQEAGVQFDIPGGIEKVSWSRDGLYDTYPDSHIGRNEGTAYKIRPGSDVTPDAFRVKPIWDWKDDMANYFLYKEDDPNNGLSTNDFKVMREYVRYYDVRYPNTDSKISVESDAKVAVRVESQKIDTGRMMIDDRDPRVTYSPTNNWATYDSSGDYNGTEYYSTANGAYCELEFYGTGIDFIGAYQNNTSKFNVYIDDVFVEQIDSYIASGQNKQQVVFSKRDLPAGNHKIKIETVTGVYGASTISCIVVDAFEVINAGAEILEPTKLVINNGWGYPYLGWGNYTGGRGRIASGSTGSATIRLSDTTDYYKINIPVASNVVIKREGNVLSVTYDESNTSANSEFDVNWYLLKIGNDEYFAEKLTAVGNTYTIPAEQFGSMIYCVVTPKEVTPGGVITGKEVRSNEIIFGEGTYRYYDVQSPPLPGFTLNPANGSRNDYIYDVDAAYTQNAYGKSVLYLMRADVSCSFTFTGDMIRLIGQRESNMGYADVTVGGETERISFYRDVPNTQTVSEVLFEKTFDEVGTYTITVNCVGSRPTGSSNNYNALDAFIVFDSSAANGYIQNPVVSNNNDVLSVDFDVYLADKADCTYEWYRKTAFSMDAYELVPGANGSSYVTKYADAGKQFVCKVTAHANGETGLSETSSNFVIARAVLVDDTNPSISYPPGSITDTGGYVDACYNSTVTYFTNGELVYNFYGTGIVWCAPIDQNGSSSSVVSIDGVAQTVNTPTSPASWTTNRKFSVEDLDLGYHTITISPSATGNRYGALDLFIVLLQEDISFSVNGQPASQVVPGATIDISAHLNAADASTMIAALYNSSGKLISLVTDEGAKPEIRSFALSLDVPSDAGLGAYIKVFIWNDNFIPLRTPFSIP